MNSGERLLHAYNAEPYGGMITPHPALGEMPLSPIHDCLRCLFCGDTRRILAIRPRA